MYGGVVVTHENIRQVYGRLKKFFDTSKDIETWHNFGCGKCRHVPKVVALLGAGSDSDDYEDCTRMFDTVDVQFQDKHDYDGTVYTQCIMLQLRHSFDYRIHEIEIGSKVWFKSSHIVVQVPIMCIDGDRYLYEVYQIAS